MNHPDRLAYRDKRPLAPCHSKRIGICQNWECQSYATAKALQNKDLRTVVIYINNIYIPFIRFLSYLNSHFAGLSYFNNFRIKKNIYIRAVRDKCQTPFFEPPCRLVNGCGAWGKVPPGPGKAWGFPGWIVL